MSEHGKSYNDQEEFRAKYLNFAETHEKILAHQSKKGMTYELGHNEFSDWSEEEMPGYHDAITEVEDLEAVDLASETASDNISLDFSPIDWREKGALNPIQNQNHCSSSYAFSAVFALETAYFKWTGILLKFSE